MKMTGPSKGVKFWECLIINALVIILLKWVRDFKEKKKNVSFTPEESLLFPLIFMLWICMHGKFIFTLLYGKVIICHFFFIVFRVLFVLSEDFQCFYIATINILVSYFTVLPTDRWIHWMRIFIFCGVLVAVRLFFFLNFKVLLTFNNSIRKSQAVRAHLCHVNI